MDRQIRPYGGWESPISGKSLVQNSLRLGQIQVDGDSIFWAEGRPTEKGRTALMTWSNSKTREITDSITDVRTRAHEYGGGAFMCAAGRQFIVNNSDQQVYEISESGPLRKLTNKPDHRFADMTLDTSRGLIYCVGEDHSNPANVENCLVSFNLEGEDFTVVAQGHDFFSNPQLSPDATQLLYLTWDHPQMPWDGTQLHLSELDGSGAVIHNTVIAGGDKESIFQPLWDPNGSIYFVSDREGWWNIYQYLDGRVSCVLKMEAEFGLPQWVFGMSRYTVLSSGDVVATYSDHTGSHIVRIDTRSGSATPIKTKYTHIDQVQGAGNIIAFLGYSDSHPEEVVAMKLDGSDPLTLRTAAETDLTDDFISRAKSIAFETGPGEESFAWYYPPRNPAFEAPKGDLPPLIVLSHGGPTANSSNGFNMAIQYWTSRGFAIVDVNYSGSTGYGRKYRERLKGEWGIRDVHDCSKAAQYLSASGLADQNKLIIKGGSAGGYTTLAALTFWDVFKAGASYYGVGDLTSLAEDTHKFESHYMDSLVGPYPEAKQRYLERSPLNYAHKLDCPVIFLQGADDKVVPPNQAESMVTALKQNGIPVAYLLFEGEAHGFRQASTVIKAIESEYYFYAKVFDIEVGESLEPVEIFNLGN